LNFELWITSTTNVISYYRLFEENFILGKPTFLRCFQYLVTCAASASSMVEGILCFLRLLMALGEVSSLVIRNFWVDLAGMTNPKRLITMFSLLLRWGYQFWIVFLISINLVRYCSHLHIYLLFYYCWEFWIWVLMSEYVYMLEYPK